MAYLLLAAQKISQCENIFILANPTCVGRYDSLGLNKFFGQANENLYLCFGQPQPLLNLMKGAVSYAHSQEILVAKHREIRTANNNVDQTAPIENLRATLKS